jgi:hypothetical protein
MSLRRFDQESMRNATESTPEIVAFRGNAPSGAQSLIAQWVFATFRVGWRYVVTFALCRYAAGSGQGSRNAIGKNLLFFLEGLGQSLGG